FARHALLKNVKGSLLQHSLHKKQNHNKLTKNKRISMIHHGYMWLIGSIVCGATCYGSDQQIKVSIKQNYNAPILEYEIPSQGYSFIDPNNVTRKLSSIALQQDINKNDEPVDMVTIVLGTYGIFHRPFQWAIGSYSSPFEQEPKD